MHPRQNPGYAYDEHLSTIQHKNKDNRQTKLKQKNDKEIPSVCYYFSTQSVNQTINQSKPSSRHAHIHPGRPENNNTIKK